MARSVHVVGLGGSSDEQADRAGVDGRRSTRLQSVKSMSFITRALRAWSVPLVQPVAQSWQSFDQESRLVDEAVAAQLRALGAEVVRAARHCGEPKCRVSHVGLLRQAQGVQLRPVVVRRTR